MKRTLFTAKSGARGKMTVAILAAALTFGSYSAPAYAHGHHGGSHHEEAHHGWTEIDGKQYYYDDSGNCVTKNCVIDGVRYKFDSSGVCHGTYTGWSKTSGKRFYYCDGIKECGWVHVGHDWYYVDEKNGRLTGEQTINGFSYRFDGRGCWDKADCTIGGKKIPARVIADRLIEEMDSGIYGGYYLCDGMVVIWSVDGKVEKFVERHHKSYGSNIVYKKADYSMYELDEMLRGLLKNCRIRYTAANIGGEYNRIEIYTLKEYAGRMQEYVNSCGMSDCVLVLN